MAVVEGKATASGTGSVKPNRGRIFTGEQSGTTSSSSILTASSILTTSSILTEPSDIFQ